MELLSNRAAEGGAAGGMGGGCAGGSSAAGGWVSATQIVARQVGGQMLHRLLFMRCNGEGLESAE